MRARSAAGARWEGTRHSPPLLAVATGPHRRGFRLSGTGHPVRRRADHVQRPSRPVRRPHHAALPGKATAEIHDYHYLRTGVLAASLAKTPSPTPASASPTRAAAPPKLCETGEISQSAQ